MFYEEVFFCSAFQIFWKERIKQSPFGYHFEYILIQQVIHALFSLCYSLEMKWK